MRVWDLYPGYLSRGNLLGQHAEIHALLSVISGDKKGYGSHPETLRWKEHLLKLKLKHDLTVKEMRLRGYRHASPCEDLDFRSSALQHSKEKICYVDHPAEQLEILREKYRQRSSSGRIPLPLRGSEFWAHHKYSIMARGYEFYKDIQDYLKSKKDLPVRQETDLIERILTILEEPVTTRAMRNVVHHLWGYFKDVATPEEKESYLHHQQEEMPALLDQFYAMSQKYQREYLLHSTVFADYIPPPLFTHINKERSRS